MRMRIRTSIAAGGIGLFVAVASLSAGQEPVFSGPQAGEHVPSFEVEGVYDELAGRRLDFVGVAAEGPLVLVFMHELTRPSAAVMRAATNYAASLRDHGLRTAIIWLCDDKSEAQRYLHNARQSLALTVPVGLSLDGIEGPGALGLNRNVALTILTIKARKVTANHALVQPGVTDLPKITADIARLVGVEPPTADQIQGSAYLGDSPGRGVMGRPTRQPDPKLRQWLRAMVADGVDAEQVHRIAREVEGHIAMDAARQQELSRLAGYLVDLGFGGEAAQRQLMKWARPANSAPPRALDDPQLREMLRPLIQLQATQEQILAQARLVERYVGDDRGKQAQVAHIAGIVLERQYGNEHGRRQFEAWLKRYGAP